MTKIKKTILSKMFSVIVGFALVFTVLFGAGLANLKNANAAEYTPVRVGPYGFSGATTWLENFKNSETGKYETSILEYDYMVANIRNALYSYDNFFTDSQKASVTETKPLYDKVWNEVFKAPHTLIDQMYLVLGEIKQRGVLYSDKDIIAEIEAKYNGTFDFETAGETPYTLDENQKNYVKYAFTNKYVFDEVTEEVTPGTDIPDLRDSWILFEKIKTEHAELVATLNALGAEIDALGEMIGSVEYSDKATIVDVATRYRALETSNMEYVNSIADVDNIAAVETELAKIVADIVAEIDVELQGMIDREIVYGDKTRINEIQADYDMLDDEDQAKVTDAANLDEAHKAIADYVESIVNDIDVTLGEMLEKEGGIVYSDKATIVAIDEAFNGLDEEDQAYVMNEDGDDKGCQDFVNLENAKKALTAILDEIARVIDEDLQAILNAGFDYIADRNTVADIEGRFQALDAQDMAYVVQKAVDFGNLQEAIAEWDNYLEKVVNDVDNTLQTMIDKPIVYEDKEAINAIINAYETLFKEDKLFVDGKMKDAANMDEARADIQAIVDAVVEAIDKELEEMLKAGIIYTDRERILEINNAYLALDAEDKAYVENAELDATGCQDFGNLQEALDALANLLKNLADAIDEDLEGLTADNLVYAEDAALIKGIVRAYEALSDVDKAELENNLCDDFANLDEAKTALKGYLDNIVKAIDEDLETLINKPIVYEDKAAILEVVMDCMELDQEDAKYVQDTCKDISNLEEAVRALYQIIADIVEAIDKELEEMLKAGITYTDRERILEINNAYLALDEDDKAFVENVNLEYEDGCQDFANLAEALAALDKILETLADKIDNDLDGITDETFIYGQHKDTVKAISDEYAALTEEDAAKVKELCEKFENLETAENALVNYLDSIVEVNDVVLEELINKPIAYEDREVVYALIVATAELDDEDLEYVMENITDDQNVLEALLALQAILDANADAIGNELGEMLERGVELSDADRINEINDAYKSFDPADQEYVQETCTDFDNLQEALDALAKVQADVEQVIDEIDNELGEMLKEGIDYSDKDRIDEIKANYDALSEESKTFVENEDGDDTGCQNFDNLQKALDALKEIQEDIDAVTKYANSLATLLSNGIKYSYKAEYDTIVATYEALDAAAKAEVEANTTFVTDKATIATALTEIETRVAAAKAAIANILYFKDGAMVNDVTGEIVYSSDVTVTEATLAVNAVYDGTANIALIEYSWGEVEINALVNAGLIANLANYDNAVAKIAEFKATAQVVADKISALVIDETNNYKVLEDTIVEVYNEYVALNFEGYNGLHNIQNYVEIELRNKIEETKTALDAANEWILKVALLVDSTATAETADEIIAKATPEFIAELRTFDLDVVESVINDYVTLTGDDSILAEVDSVMVASVSDAFDVLMSIVNRINEITEDLVNDITDIITKEPNFVEGDFETSEEVKDIYRDLTDSQKELLDEVLAETDDSYAEFLEVAEKLLFVEYFRQAVAELYAEHQDGYYTVEGYVLEKTLLALYNTLEQGYQDLIGNETIENLLEVDAVYAQTTDLLDYNKIKTEMEELVNDALDTINSNLDTLETEIEAVREDLEEKISDTLALMESKLNTAKNEILANVAEDLGDIQAILDKLQVKVTEVETTLNSEIQSEIAGLKNTLETKINTTKENLENAIKALQEADKEHEEELDSLKKIVYIGGGILAGVSALLFILVIVLFAKTCKLNKKLDKNNTEDDEDEPEEEADEEENQD